ncbi:hypothetical protein [Neisseria sicca]|uniref:hypothetical protein n=1 Tax=Neisseria sicca TaxID=490 RepID=UPI001649A306|nr:hypothetical protein [Neisseria sicca]
MFSVIVVVCRQTFNPYQAGSLTFSIVCFRWEKGRLKTATGIQTTPCGSKQFFDVGGNSCRLAAVR